ncbi:MAG: hypothetical protein Kow0010_20790 [Dehalococcoidia bacterium]
MDWLAAGGAAVAAAVLGWLAAGSQHHLYREPEFRTAPAAGRKLLALRLFCGVSGGVAAGLAFRPGHYDAGPALMVATFALGLVVLASTDLERRRIPNRLTYPLMGAAAALSWAWPDRGTGDIWAGAAVAAGVAAAMFALGLVFGAAARTTAFGLGDAKLIVLLGLLLGWPAVMSGLVFALLAGGAFSLGMIVSGRARGTFSYGPFLAFGGLVVLLFPDRFV